MMFHMVIFREGFMDRETLIQNLLVNYGKFGITRTDLEPIIDDGIQNYNLSLEAVYSG